MRIPSLLRAVLGAVGCLSLPAVAHAQNPVYPNLLIDAGPLTEGSSAGDINGDLIQDFATMLPSSNTVTTWISDGAGGAISSSVMTYGSTVKGVALADMNHDAIIDLVAGLNESIDVRLGIGNGNFGPPLVHLGGTLTTDLLADLNGDGHLDAVGNGPGYTWLVSLGDGTGGFSVTQSTPAPIPRWRSAFGDLNGDGKLDLVTVGNEAQAAYLNSQLGDGAGHFGAAIIKPIAASANDIALGDWNSDGKLDCAIPISNNQPLVHWVSTWLGDGLGNFNSQVNMTGVGFGTMLVNAGDVNGDGKLDLVAGAFGSITTLLGNGTGVFTNAGTIPTETLGRRSVLRDLDHDGKLDLGILLVPPNGPLSRGTIRTLHGDGSGGFTALYPSNTVSDVPVGTDARSVAIGDVNSDSILDLCTANYQSNDVSVALGIGNGSFLPATPLAAPGNPRRIALADFDANGTLDILTSNWTANTLSVRLGDGQGGFAPALDSPNAPARYDMGVGDFDADGKLDVVSINNLSTSNIAISLGLGSGLFAAPVTLNLGFGASGLAVADINLDGRPDVVVCNQGGSDVRVLIGNGSGGFTVVFYSVSPAPRSLAIGDVNGDGKPDIVTTNGLLSGPQLAAQSVSILLAIHAGVFGGFTTQSIASDPRSIDLADVNLDGKLDIVTGHAANRVCLLLGNGQGGFSPATHHGIDVSAEDLVIADVNADGKPDVVTCGGSLVSILVNRHEVPAAIAYCFGDGTSAACPCGNTGAAGNGCPNAAWPGGARLAASGVASVSTDSFTLTGTFVPDGPGLMIQATGAADAPFNDGKVCVSGSIVRLGVVFAAANTSQLPNATSPTAIGLLGGVPIAGGQRYYQLFYRDADAGFCTFLLHNMTNGIAVAWVP